MKSIITLVLTLAIVSNINIKTIVASDKVQQPEQIQKMIMNYEVTDLNYNV